MKVLVTKKEVIISRMVFCLCYQSAMGVNWCWCNNN